ncbi:DUF4236 domain-containing protein (plasmid) [Acinetobacter baumannii]
MSAYFLKHHQLFPGFKINLTHKGISSASIGKPGASVNIGKKGTRTSVGIPGTGLSYSKHRPYTKKANTQQSSTQQQPIFAPTQTAQSKSKLWLWIAFGVVCFIVGAVIF